jgi:hypothetical protein
MTAESIHTSCLRYLGLPQVGAGRANAMIQAPYYFNKDCFDVVLEEVVWL